MTNISSIESLENTVQEYSRIVNFIGINTLRILILLSVLK